MAGVLGFSASAFHKRLPSLGGTQQSIAAFAQWLGFYSAEAAPVTDAWKEALQSAQTSQQRLHLIFVAHELVLNATKSAQRRTLQSAFQELLPDAVKELLRDGDPEIHRAICRLSEAWKAQQLLPSEFLKELDVLLKPPIDALLKLPTTCVELGKVSAIQIRLRAHIAAAEAADASGGDAVLSLWRAAQSTSEELTDALQGLEKRLEQQTAVIEEREKERVRYTDVVDALAKEWQEKVKAEAKAPRRRQIIPRFAMGQLVKLLADGSLVTVQSADVSQVPLCYLVRYAGGEEKEVEERALAPVTDEEDEKKGEEEKAAEVDLDPMLRDMVRVLDMNRAERAYKAAAETDNDPTGDGGLEPKRKRLRADESAAGRGLPDALAELFRAMQDTWSESAPSV